MKKFIVTTSIYPPSKATLKYAEMTDWNLIIVGDEKTPHEDYLNLHYQYDDKVIYLTPFLQDKNYKELSDAIGWNKVMRRNIGFVEAYRRGADIVATIDDDNIPYDNWGKSVYVGQTERFPCYISKDSRGVLDVMQLTNHPELWHRGYPIDYISKSKNIDKAGTLKIKVLFQADLWDGDPDVDAVCRKMYNPKGLKLILDTPFTTLDYAPFNSQNTFIAREALPYYMVLPYVGRMDDIWGGYIAQYLLSTSPVFMPPTVWQERNEQSLDQNFRDEVLGYTTTYKMLQDMDNWKKYLPEKALHAFNIYRREYEK